MTTGHVKMVPGLLVLVLVVVSTVQGLGKDPSAAYHSLVSDSLNVAFSEHEARMEMNRHLLMAGVDGQNTDGGHTNMHSMLRPVKNFTMMNTNVAMYFSRATQLMSKKLKMSLKQMLDNPPLVHAWLNVASATCSPRFVKCPPTPFRSADGTCNNLKHPTWGQAFRPQQRWIPSAYADGIDVPRMFSVTGKPLPSPRVISNIVHSSGRTFIDSPRFSNWIVAFGQQISHDVAETPMAKGANDAAISCCRTDPKTLTKRPECLPIRVPPHDPRFPNPCMNFVRSGPATEDSCVFGPRNQVNQISSYLDVTFLYGADFETQSSLRAFKFGLLKMTKNGLFTPEPPAPGRCTRQTPKDYCMRSGDPRGHHVPSLISSHVVFLREHNRIATILAHLNPHWSDERLFQEARKIVIAEYTNVVYLEFLPKVIGPHLTASSGLFPTPKGHNTVYNPKTDATLFNSFSAAAFRFGHSQIPANVGLLHLDGSHMDVPLEHTFNKPTLAVKRYGKGAEDIIRSLGRSPASRSDRFVDKSVRDYLFLDHHGQSFDLVAINLQRGRDHGIAGYNAWRRWCGLKPAIHMGPGPGGLFDMDPQTAVLIGKTYKHVEDIDLFTGGLGEVPVKGGSVGPTFACLIARQFADLKFGDRFYYENAFPTGFTKPQLNQIKRTRLSSLLCNNMKEFTSPRDVYLLPSPTNPEVPCSKVPPIDLSFWKEMVPPPMPKGIFPPMVHMSKLFWR